MKALLDANAYIGEWPFRRLRHSTPKQVLSLMSRADIERAFVSSLTAVFRQDTGPCNEQLLDTVANHRDRLLPLATINPSYPDWQSDLPEPGRFAGVRLYPNYHGYQAEEAMPLVQESASRGLPVFIAVRLQDERQHHPAAKVAAVAAESLGRLADSCPSARIVATMARLGEAKELLKHPNIFIDLSGIQGPAGCIESLVDEFGSHRLLFGTGIPLQYPLPNVIKLDMARISESDRLAIRWGNAAGLVGGQ